MKHVLSLPRLCAAAIVCCALFASCDRVNPEHKERFKASLSTWYRVSPVAPAPLTVNGSEYVALANLVVRGEGHAEPLGAIRGLANTLSYSSSAEGAPLGGVGSPVKEIPTYPVTGGPLPLIQMGDFSGVPQILSSLHVPTKLHGQTINVVLFNTQGDAVFLSSIPGTGRSSIISPTVGGYYNDVLIVGGAGKYKNATGKLMNNGHFSFVAPYDGEDSYEGWISY